MSAKPKRGRPAYPPLSASQVRREIAALRRISTDVSLSDAHRFGARMAMWALDWARGAPSPLGGARLQPTSAVIRLDAKRAHSLRTRAARAARRL